ncbi:hypothetical protein ACE3NQ_30075 [Paenibacillus terreus]|uniref:Uncharacterized protein n=1 Tax=Paenibacillus terreus TaxID=1387834 RepID=A0ABV5BHF5_9BACL
MHHPYDDLFTSFSRTKEEAVKRIMESFEEAGMQSQHSAYADQFDLRPELGNTLEAPKNHVIENLQRTFEQIQQALKQHYPDAEDNNTSVQELWSELHRIAFSPSDK